MTARHLTRLALVALVLALPGVAWPSTAPSWTFDLAVSRWIAPSQFSAQVTRQRAGMHVRNNLPVTLRLDRRTVCRQQVSDGASRRIRCATLRAKVGLGDVAVRTSGQFETGRLGAIGFRARTLLVIAPHA